MFCFKCGTKLLDGAVFCSSCGASIGNVPTNSQTPAGAGSGTPASYYSQPAQPKYYTQTPTNANFNPPSMNQSYYQAQQPGSYAGRPAAPYPGASSGIGIFKVVSFVLPLILLIMVFFGWFTGAGMGYGAISIPQLVEFLKYLFQMNIESTIFGVTIILMLILILIAVIAFLAYIYKAAQAKEFHTGKLRTVFVCIDLVFILSLITMIIIGSGMGLSVIAYITGSLSILATFIVPSQLRNELAQNKQPIMR